MLRRGVAIVLLSASLAVTGCQTSSDRGDVANSETNIVSFDDPTEPSGSPAASSTGTVVFDVLERCASDRELGCVQGPLAAKGTVIEDDAYVYVYRGAQVIRRSTTDAANPLEIGVLAYFDVTPVGGEARRLDGLTQWTMSALSGTRSMGDCTAARLPKARVDGAEYSPIETSTIRLCATARGPSDFWSEQLWADFEDGSRMGHSIHIAIEAQEPDDTLLDDLTATSQRWADVNEVAVEDVGITELVEDFGLQSERMDDPAVTGGSDVVEGGGPGPTDFDGQSEAAGSLEESFPSGGPTDGYDPFLDGTGDGSTARGSLEDYVGSWIVEDIDLDGLGSIAGYGGVEVGQSLDAEASYEGELSPQVVRFVGGGGQCPTIEAERIVVSVMPSSPNLSREMVLALGDVCTPATVPLSATIGDDRSLVLCWPSTGQQVPGGCLTLTR